MLGSWATAHPLALGHDTMVCIVTSMAGCTAKGATTRRSKPRYGHYSATIQPGGLRYGAVRSAGSRVAIQRFVSWLRGRLWVVIQWHCAAIQRSSAPRYCVGRLATRRRSCDTARSDMSGGAATQPATSPDTAEHRPTTRSRHGRSEHSVVACARRLGQGVHLVHPTQF